MVFYVGGLNVGWIVGSFGIEELVYGEIFLRFNGVEFCKCKIVNVVWGVFFGYDFVVVEDDRDVVFSYLDVEFDELSVILGG